MSVEIVNSGWTSNESEGRFGRKVKVHSSFPKSVSSGDEREIMTNLVRLMEEGSGEILPVLDSVEGDKCALHVAASSGNAMIVRGLLRMGARVNQRTAGGATALHYACFKQNAKIVRLLLDYGADVDIVGESSWWNNEELTAKEILHHHGLSDDEIGDILEPPLSTRDRTVIWIHTHGVRQEEPCIRELTDMG
eukprot:TRINITY_DN3422_c4_g1_i1.p1 TRINITY_DN3422_c4_g1~~TRINITY_DN3422_c4_g1_i1.p1  ORF type:complete len:193 (-),score=57.21 TRINITY_DN3422_c4_g1_i1:1190-1768(-)